MAANRKQFYARKLFELCGILPLGAFLLEHLLSNFQVVTADGPARFDAYVVGMQTNTLVRIAEIVVIALPLAYHALYGLFVAKMSAPNAGAYGYARNWTYVLQRASGVALIVYIGYHVYNTRLMPELHPELATLQHDGARAFVSTRYLHDYFNAWHLGMQVKWIYVVGLALGVYHFANGAWNVLVHWGVTITPRAQRRAALACALVGVALYVVGLASLFTFAGDV